MKTDPNEPAFAMPASWSPGGDWQGGPHFGLTKREAFAMAAMQGFMAQNDDRRYAQTSAISLEDWQSECRANDARYCVAMADALIAALNEEPKT